MLSGDHIVNPDIKMAVGDPIITVAGSSSLTLNGVLSDAVTGQPAALTLVGPGTLTLTGANTYTGPTIVQSGTLRWATQALVVQVPICTLAGGTFPDAGASIVLNHGFTIAGNAAIAPANNLTIAGVVAYTSRRFHHARRRDVDVQPCRSYGQYVRASGFNAQAGTFVFGGAVGTVFNVAAQVNIAADSLPAGANATVLVTGYASFVDNNALKPG